LINSNLTDHFEQALSINAIEKYKPAAETYLYRLKTRSCKTTGNDYDCGTWI
jgi:2-haloacid dehalogenase